MCAALLLVTDILLCPLAGLVASKFSIYGSVALFGSLLNLVGLCLLFAEFGPPLLVLVLLGAGFALAHTVMASVLQGLAPLESLGLANGVLNAAICAAIGLGDTAIGVSVRGQASDSSWRRSAAFLLGVAVLQLAALLLFLVADFRAPWRVLQWNERSGEEREDLEVAQPSA